MGQNREVKGPFHDRALLLHGAKRNRILTLADVEQYGRDSFGDPNYVSLYGMSPREGYARGIRLLGRTAVECTRDMLADLIGRDLAATVKRLEPTPGILALDPFAGSVNTLYWILRHLPGSEGLAFELDPRLFELTKRNIATLHLPIELLEGDYETLLANRALPAERALVVFVAPSWGSALDERHGLDLRRTTPPVTEIIASFRRRFPTHRLLFGVQVYEKVDAASVAEVTGLLDSAELCVYSINGTGRNHGLLIGSRSWAAQSV